MKPLVSVVVPVYKVEKYLIRCLDSLRAQNLHNIEIILVDDASPDRCGEICDEYVAQDTRFKVIHHLENRGLSVARNTGIRNATADYLMFVDSDDWVHEDFCKMPYECVVHYRVDVVLFNYKVFGNRIPVEDKSLVNSALTESGYRNQTEAIDLLQGFVGQAAWNKLYKRSLFNGISYPDGYLCEDWGTTYKLILKANRIYYLDKALYYYYLRTGSITSLKSEKSLRNWIELALQQYQDLATWGYPEQKLESFLLRNGFLYCIQKRRDKSDKYYMYFEERIKHSRNIPDTFKWNIKILFFVFKYCSPLFELICTLFGKKIY